jgi:hypothetical protein
LTCGRAAPVDNEVTVATQFGNVALQARNLVGADVAIAIVDTGINLPYLSANRAGIGPTLLDAAAS